MAGAVLRHPATALLAALFLISPGMLSVRRAEAEMVTQGMAIIDGADAIAATDEHFICATLDWWPSDTCNYGTCAWGQASILNLDLSSPNLLNAIKAFSPLKLRLGGSLDDRVIYGIGEQGPCKPFVKNTSALFEFNEGCLPMSRWDQLNQFFKQARVDVIFGLNALNGRVRLTDGSLGGPWNYTNAASLIRYTVNKGYKVFGWELGNELSGKGIKEHIHATRYANDVIALKKLVYQIYKGHSAKPLIIAPAGNFEEKWYRRLIVKTKPSSSLDVVTHHIYSLGSGVDENLVEKILDPSYLDGVASLFSGLREVLKNTGTSATAWVGEAGGAYHSGRHLVTDAFVSSFWYLDQLALSSRYDTKAYCRQSLIGGNYGLLNTTTFKPNPDYYSALLWHRLMGPKVLSTAFTGTKKIRAYAHCARHSKGITLLLLNLDPKTAVKVRTMSATNTVNMSTKGTREEYHLTSQDGNLHSQTVLLNGKALDVNSNGVIPSLKPKLVDHSQPINVAPLSIVFAHLPYFHQARACI